MKLLSKVIKASQYGPFMEEPVFQSAGVGHASVEEQRKLILEEAFQKAKQIIESAQSYSSAQLRDCAQRVEEELQEAKKQGYQDGFSRGREEGEKAGLQSGMRQGISEGEKRADEENQTRLNELSEMIRSVEKSKTEILAKFESDLTDLAVTIAKTIIKRELEADPGVLHAIVQNAVDSYRNQAWVRIYVSGNTAKLLTKADVSIAKELESVSDHVKVVVTPGIGDEACVIEMPDQVIDAGVDTQLNKIQSAMHDSERSEQ
ncbi:Flagellar assembly protein FliH [Caprobacter fermentans]|uniref:Flagellar assembly protein FliH n=1 Tax=Caproicibacter fermentans TaxID=2576756 RepID=A0A6N8HVV9_9FIRM|nr:Flagellar assembly protein FliH [Caproicibacter fermentans]